MWKVALDNWLSQFPFQTDAFRGHGLSLLDEQARLWGLRLMLFPLESPPSTPITLKFIMCKTDNYKWSNVGTENSLFFNLFLLWTY